MGWVRLEGIEGQEIFGGRVGGDGDESESDLIEAVGDVDQECFFFFGLFSDEGFDSKPGIVVVQGGHHGKFEVVFGVAIVNRFEGLDLSVGVDIDRDSSVG